MAGNGAHRQVLVSLFKVEKYNLWSLKMKTMFISQEFWDLVENGFDDTNPAVLDQQLREKHKKDTNALFFHSISLGWRYLVTNRNRKYISWSVENLKREFIGDKKVITVKLHTLCQFWNNFDEGKINYTRVKGKEKKIKQTLLSKKMYGLDFSWHTKV